METRIVEIGGKDYRVQEDGQIFKRRGTGFLKPFPDKDGYLKIVVGFTGGHSHNEFVHRLVYKAFHGEIPDGYTVDHNDSDRLNNHPSNLKLMTAEENAIKGNARFWTLISPRQEVIEVYNLAKFCRENGLHKGHMSDVHLGKKSHHKGWRIVR